MKQLIIEKHEDYKLSWEFINQKVTEVMLNLAGHLIPCHAVWDSADYWSIVFDGYRMPPAELEIFCDRLGAGQEEKASSLPEEPGQSVGSLGMELAGLLLQSGIGCRWQHVIAELDGLWIIGCSAEDMVKVGDRGIWLKQLRPKEDILDYLRKNGSNRLALINYCRMYRLAYQKDLCWSYPVMTEGHLGIMLVLVKEGILALPYDKAEKNSREIFDLESACIIETEKEMGRLIEEWARFSDELREIMSRMYRYLQNKEKTAFQNNSALLGGKCDE